MSQFFYIHPDNPQARLINQAVEIVRKGGVIVYPTDSGYALGCKIEDKGAMERICRIRQLPDGHNFTLMCRDLSELSTYAFVDNVAFRLMKNNTPGNYTFILKGTKEVPRRLLQEKRKTIGMRVPSNPIAQALLETLGEPMLSTSLMLPGSDFTESDPEEIKDRLEKVVDLIIHGGFLGQQPEKVARTFERDDLLSAAVIDADGKLIGRLTIDEIVDVVYEETDNDLRRMGGLSDEEDVFAPVSKAVKTRWAWLAVNLCTAFIASRVIDGFEHTISQLVALASLMPIVAGIGGNTGNQTITMIVRAMALQQIQPGSFTFLILREMGVALINGLVWGGIMGAITWWLYDDPQLGGVMTLAMMLNLLMAAMMGVIIPMVMVKLGRDPAVGSSVMITAITDTGGFFIFLGLATLFLM